MFSRPGSAASTPVRHPGDREILFALSTFSAKARNRPAAIGYAKQLVELGRQDPEARKLLEELTNPQPPGSR